MTNTNTATVLAGIYAPTEKYQATLKTYMPILKKGLRKIKE
ncbi:hypothetical protein PFLA_a0943 [Pseudoalteromonas flavipulchra NCIMB 2033 = ATCC BAA-314]|nr:hypothetical protein [Pseudoalteromonas flavipulchra NCIMB 2033 = ATCC BAA-314]